VASDHNRNDDYVPLKFDGARIERAVAEILDAMGEDVTRQGLRDTPRRVARAYAELFWGIGRDPGDELTAVFESEQEEMVVVKDIPFHSVCEHHLLPFVGAAHVAYIPSGGKITGLSKLARCVESAARRPQVQERLTGQVADAIMTRLGARGVLVVVEAEHLCMTMRGIRKPGSRALTSAVRGEFMDDEKTRAEAFALINRGR